MSETTTLTAFCRHMKEYEFLTAGQEAECYMTGDTDKLVLHNLRLVVKLAYKYRGRGLEVEDLISEGCIGLIAASKQYNPTKGRFSTIAWYKIMAAMTRAVNNQSRLIRIPGWAIYKYLEAAERKRHE